MRRRNRILLIIFIPVIVVIVIFAIFLFYGKEETLNLVIKDIDLSKVKDGVYVGSYSKGRFSYKVEVTVKNKKIENIIVIEKPYISLEDVPQKIISRVLEKQSLSVDVVTGATVTSKAVLKAIENALSK